MGKGRKDDVTNAIDDETKRPLALKYDHFTCKVNAEEYADYSKEKLGLLRTKCSEFYPCTQELNKSNVHLIFSGKTIQLSTFCRLLYANKYGNYGLDNICSVKERQALAHSIGEALDHELNESPPSATATRLRRCISRNKLGSEKNIDTVCRIRMNAKWSNLCKDRSVYNLSETVFNHELQHLHCMCNSLPAPTNSVRDKSITYIGAACSASVLTTLFIIVFFLCYRRRKIKRNKSTPSLSALREDSLAPAYIRGCSQVYETLSGENNPSTRQTPAPSAQVTMPVDKSSVKAFMPVEKSSTQVIMPVTKSFHYSKELLQAQEMVSEGDPVYSIPFSGISSGPQLRAVSNCNPTYYVNCPLVTEGHYICMSHTASCQCRQFLKSQYENLASGQITDTKIVGDYSRQHPKVLESEYI